MLIEYIDVAILKHSNINASGQARHSAESQNHKIREIEDPNTISSCYRSQKD